MDSTELLKYAGSVVLIPAFVACCAAAPALVGPFRTRRSIVEMSAGFALALAFLVSFVRETSYETISRQFPWSAVESAAPIERWHRLALIAVALAILAPVLSTLRVMSSRGVDRLLSVGFVVSAAFVIGSFVEFPESSFTRQLSLGLLCGASAYAFTLAGGAALWSAAVVFATLAVLAMLSGCASFAVLCTATAVAAAGMAATTAIAGWKSSTEGQPVAGGAFALVAGVLAASVAMAGRAYDTMGIPPWSWFVVACLPVGALLFGGLARRSPNRGAATFWKMLGVLLLAIAAFLAVASLHPLDDSDASDSADPMDGIYGG